MTLTDVCYLGIAMLALWTVAVAGAAYLIGRDDRPLPLAPRWRAPEGNPYPYPRPPAPDELFWGDMKVSVPGGERLVTTGELNQIYAAGPPGSPPALVPELAAALERDRGKAR